VTLGFGETLIEGHVTNGLGIRGRLPYVYLANWKLLCMWK